MARDIPGVLDVLFPRLSGGLVASLNRSAFKFEDIVPVFGGLVDQTKLQKAMLFELAVVRAERILAGESEPDWGECTRVAAERQRRHYDADIPGPITECDMTVADHAARNLVHMLGRVLEKHPQSSLEVNPAIPGLGWIASGTGDFAVGRILVEVKHTDRNFVSGDFRQILMYWILKYSASIENDEEVWTDCLLLNPRRNSAIIVNFNNILRSASANLNRVEIYELLRSVAGSDFEGRV